MRASTSLRKRHATAARRTDQQRGRPAMIGASSSAATNGAPDLNRKRNRVGAQAEERGVPERHDAAEPHAEVQAGGQTAAITISVATTIA